MSTPTPDTPAPLNAGEREELARLAEAEACALADELCEGSTHPRDEETGVFHCQECYDIACTVMDSSWLKRSRAALAERVERAKAVIPRLEERVGTACGPSRYDVGQRFAYGLALRMVRAALDVSPEPDETGGGR